MALLIKKANKNGFCFSLGEKLLSSKYNPVREGKRIIEGVKDKFKITPKNSTDKAFILFLGYFPIYHILEIIEDYLSTNILVFEDNDIPKKELELAWNTCVPYELLKDNFNQLKFFSRLENLQLELSSLSKNVLQSLIIIPSPYVQASIASEFHKLFLNLYKRKLSEANTINHFGILWELNTLNNLKYLLANKISFLSSLHWQYQNILINNTETNHPVIFISSGPLLDDYLLEHTDKRNQLISLSKIIPVITVPSITKRLVELGLNVAAIFTSDAGFPNTYHFMHHHKLLNDIPIIAPLSIYPSILRSSKKKICYYDLEIIDDDILNAVGRENYITPDASIVLSGIRFLARMEFKNIFTIGVDFTMYPFKEHAQSNTSEELWFSSMNRLKNYTTLTHNTYHFDKNNKAVLIEDRFSTNSVLEIYKNEFNKLKSTLAKKNIYINEIQELIRNLSESRITKSNFKNQFLNISNTSINLHWLIKLLNEKITKKYFNKQNQLDTKAFSENNQIKNDWLLNRLQRIVSK